MSINMLQESPCTNKVRDLEPEHPSVLLSHVFYSTKHWYVALKKKLTKKNKEGDAEYAKFLAKRKGDQREIPGTLPKAYTVLSDCFCPQSESSQK